MSETKARLWPWIAGFAGLLALDQWTKWLVRESFFVGESIPLIGKDLVRLTYVQNPGIAFGLEPLSPTVLLIFGSFAAIALAVYLVRLIHRRDILVWPVFLFLCGAVGNSIDRAAFGVVTDFVDCDFPDFIMTRWPVFNVADSCVTIGITILIFQTIFRRQTDSSQASSGERTDTSSLSHSGGARTASDPSGSLSDSGTPLDLPE